MEWWHFLLAFFGLAVFFMFLGMPVFYSFFLVNIMAVAYIIGLDAGMNQVVLSIYNSLSDFNLTPIPFFVLMGEVLFYSGLVVKTLDVLSMFFGRIPGRLSILSIAGGTLFAAMSGSSIANTSMLGAVLVPDMRSRGYHTSMVVGPILASGSLAMIIPPSNLAVLFGSIAHISIRDLLIAGILPGIVMSSAFLLYVVIKCFLNPSLAPSYDVEYVNWKTRIQAFAKYVLPTSLIIFLVLSFIFFGIATPTESAAIGAIGAFLIVASAGFLNKEVIWKSLTGTLKISGTIFMIIAASSVFSQLLAYTGATTELINILTSLEISRMWILLMMLLIVLLLGCFLDPVSIMMIALPLFMPIVHTLDFNPVWFGIIMLIGIDLGNLTPPLGMLLYVMKSVSPKDITMADIIKSAFPFFILELSVVLLIIIFPIIATWLPSISS